MDEQKGMLKFISIHRDAIFMSLVLSFIYSGVVLITYVILLSLPSGILPLIFSIVWYGLEFLMYLMGLIYIFGD
jgi:hypothetical protein